MRRASPSAVEIGGRRGRSNRGGDGHDHDDWDAILKEYTDSFLPPVRVTEVDTDPLSSLHHLYTVSSVVRLHMVAWLLWMAGAPFDPDRHDRLAQEVLALCVVCAVVPLVIGWILWMIGILFPHRPAPDDDDWLLRYLEARLDT